MDAILKKKTKDIILPLIKFVITLILAFFVFKSVQSAEDIGIDKLILNWVLPFVLALNFYWLVGVVLEKISGQQNKIIITGSQFGLTIGVVFFVFQVIQSWVDVGIDKSALRWIFPLALSLNIFGFTGLYLLILNLSNRKQQINISPAEKLANAVLEYGKQLNIDGRDRVLVNLRNSLSETLHILGFHDIRTQLGEIAICSATILNDEVAKAEILIDDLGWANYLLNNREISIQNIERGMSIANKSKAQNSLNYARLSLCEAKGLRHLAIITNDVDFKVAREILNKAFIILKSLPDQTLYEVKRDIAQIYHAEALVIAMSLGIHKAGCLRKGDVEGFARTDEALSYLREASSIFKEISDLSRYVKALFLEVRLLEAKGATTEAMEISALRDRTLAASEWVRPEGLNRLTG